MKKMFYLSFFALPCLFATSCKKNSSSGNTGGGSAELVRMQQGFGANDSVFLLKYDAQKRLVSVTDSINADTLVGTYNASNQIINIVEHNLNNSDHISFLYNASGQLTEADYTIAGEVDQYLYEYTGGSLTKKTWNSDNGTGGGLVQQFHYAITVTGGNITDEKQYDPSNVLLDDRKMTYGSQPNIFKNLTLFNWANRLGTFDIISGELETFFCNNVLTSATLYNTLNQLQGSVADAPVFNSASNPTSIVATEKDGGGNIGNVFSWGFSYK